MPNSQDMINIYKIHKDTIEDTQQSFNRLQPLRQPFGTHLPPTANSEILNKEPQSRMAWTNNTVSNQINQPLNNILIYLVNCILNDLLNHKLNHILNYLLNYILNDLLNYLLDYLLNHLLKYLLDNILNL